MNPIKIISASAGSGKTYRLAEELKTAVLAGEVRADAVIATTFTVKAASELRRRVRSHLLAAGRNIDAQRLAAARIGTVNAVCGRLASEFAFELGLSPELAVLDEAGAKRALSEALSSVLTADDEYLAARLDHMFGGNWDWQAYVREIVSLARSNRIDSAALLKCADQSKAGWYDLVANPTIDHKVLNSCLLSALKAFLKGFESVGDTTQRTADAKRVMRDAHRLMSADRPLPWPIWVKLASLTVGVRSRELAQPVIEAASAHDIHPGLRDDVGAAVDLLYDLAGRTLDAYDLHKRERGVIDFVDQETYALRLLDRSDVKEQLAARLDLVLIDEFQDTSPIQLAIFLKLAEIAGRSVWVGDQKQAIYGFRGTDPALMDAAIDQILAGDEPETLPTSWRSRPTLVMLTSDLFAPAFEAVGIPPARVYLHPAHEEEPEGLGEVIEYWSLASTNKGNDALALADTLSQMLDDNVMVRDPATLAGRPLRPGDVAILCRTNDTCAAVAHTIEARGIRAVLPRLALLSTLEARVVRAGLRVFVDEDDTLAAAELAYLIEYAADGDAWLSQVVQAAGSNVLHDCDVVGGVLSLRDPNAHASPLGALDAVIEATRVVELCHRWGGTAPRLANLERLRAHAVNYVHARHSEGYAASTAGLIRYWEELAQEELDAQGVATGEDAVTVSTWHAAKGLEWPVTVLFELDDRSADRDALGVQMVSDRTEFDLADPLADRWIRCWLYPYGQMSKGVPLLKRLQAHAATNQARDRRRCEAMRLLYVGWTRARDRLVLAARPKKLAGGTLSLLKTDDVEGISEPTEPNVEWAGHQLVVKIRHGALDVVEQPIPEPEPALPMHEPRVHPPAWRLPSAVERSGPTGSPTMLGARTAVKGSPNWDDLGNAVHGFLCADRKGLTADARQVIAQRQLDAWSVDDALEVGDLIAMADRLWTWVETDWPGAVLHREWPLVQRADDGSCWKGNADLVLELDDRMVLIDHKSFPGSPDQAADVAGTYWGQLDAYSHILQAATGKPVTKALVHFPVLGVVVPLALAV